MYDKLGDLLNETLEKGSVEFVKVKDKIDNAPKENETNEFDSNQKKNRIDTESYSHKAKRTKKEKPKVNSDIYIYKKITPEIERACRLLNVTENCSLEELKKAYKEKLKYYHPDHYSNNPVLYRVSTNKTREVVEAYNLLIGLVKN